MSSALNGSAIQCWDNSTRGLDSANALEFCKTLNLMAKYAASTVAVAIYQASQNAYNVRPTSPTSFIQANKDDLRFLTK